MAESTERFALLDPQQKNPQQKQALNQRRIPETLGSLQGAAQYYQPDPGLVDAVNVALAVGAPLLLTGEPGTGKTQVAFYLAWYFDIALYPLYVRSASTADDLFYFFDAVGYLHAAGDRSTPAGKIDKKKFIQEGPLWKALEDSDTSIVLIDEIDKASRDFPNDLLNALDQHQFDVRELDRPPFERNENQPPPLVVITSNSERRLPEPFLRRCIFHQIEFTDDLLKKAVEARKGDFPDLPPDIRQQAIKQFIELRNHEVQKKPATAELLTWLTILNRKGEQDWQKLWDCRPADLPALSALIKNRDDLAILA